MKLRTSLLAMIASLAATGAFAETNYAEVSLSYNQIDLVGAGPEINERDFFGAYEGSTGAFTYGVDASYLKYTIDTSSLEFKMFNIELGYAFSPALTVVAGGNRFEYFNVTFDTYSAGVEYAYNDFTFGLGASQVDFGGGVDDTGYGFVEYDNDTYSLNAGYTELSGLDVWSVGAGYKTDRFDLEMDVVALVDDGSEQGLMTLDGKFNILENVRLVGEVNHYFFDFDEDGVTRYDFGAGYQIRDNVWIDATIGGQSYIGEKMFDTMKLGVTFETGKRKLRTRDNLFNLGQFYENFFLIIA